MEQPPPDTPPPPDDYDVYGPEYTGYDSFLYSPFFHFAVLAFTIWMIIDSVKRYGFSYWAFIIFFFQPLGGIVYLILHARQIFTGIAAGSHHGAGEGPGLFGMGLRNRIAAKEKDLRMADTEAARAELGELYYQAQRFDEAATQFEKVLEFDDENLDATYHLAMCRHAQGDFAAARPYLEKVMAQDKKYKLGSAWLAYSDCLLADDKLEAALEERRALSRSFPRPMMEYAYAEALHKAEQFDKAREVLEDMIATADQAPREDRVYVKRGQGLLRSLPT